MPFGLRLLFWVSAFSTACCAAVHVLTFAGVAFPPVVFVVLAAICGPALRGLAAGHLAVAPARRAQLRLGGFGNIPRWMKYLAGALLVYAFANFYVAARSTTGRARRLGDETPRAADRDPPRARSVTGEFRHGASRAGATASPDTSWSFCLAVIVVRSIWIKKWPRHGDAQV